jgi:hypothetical protein
MSFDRSTFRKLVSKYHGWIDAGIARFPTVYLKEQFLKELARCKT